MEGVKTYISPVDLVLKRYNSSKCPARSTRSLVLGLGKNISVVNVVRLSFHQRSPDQRLNIPPLHLESRGVQTSVGKLLLESHGRELVVSGRPVSTVFRVVELNFIRGPEGEGVN